MKRIAHMKSLRRLLLASIWLPAVVVAQGFSSVSSVPQAAQEPTPPSPVLVIPESVPVNAASGGFASISSLVPGSSAGAGPQTAGDERLADKVLVEKGARRLHLLQGEKVIGTYPIRLGLNPYGHKRREGDFRTPEGNYRLVRRNPNSRFFLSIEISYPNREDAAVAKEEGFSPGGLIMIHGQPNDPRKSAEYYARNDWTDGCIAVSNLDMMDIWRRAPLGIPIEIRP